MCVYGKSKSDLFEKKNLGLVFTFQQGFEPGVRTRCDPDSVTFGCSSFFSDSSPDDSMILVLGMVFGQIFFVPFVNG